MADNASPDISASAPPSPAPAPAAPAAPDAPKKLVLTPDQVTALGCSGDCTINLSNAVPGDDGSITYDAEVEMGGEEGEEGEDGQEDILGYKRPAGPNKETPDLSVDDLRS